MKCPECNFPRTRVLKTRHDDEEGTILRIRHCLGCGYKFSSREIVEEGLEPRIYRIDYVEYRKDAKQETDRG